MTATGHDAAPVSALPSSEEQAASLWAFVHLKTPRFTSAAALEVVRALAPTPDADTKALAWRLRKELLRFGVALKHVNAIEAASRLQGQKSWHGGQHLSSTPRLKAYGVLEADEKHAEFESWRDAAAQLADWVETAVRHTGVKVVELQLGADFVMLAAPWVRADKGRKIGQELPLFVVNPTVEGSDWLDGLPAALETVRRRIEEPGLAIMEGFSTISFAPSLAEAPNTELVLIQTEAAPDDGFEIARGNEVTCWTQFDLARQERGAEQDVSTDGAAWRCGTARFVWQTCTATASEGAAPTTAYVDLDESQVARLTHRYRLARNILKDGVHSSAMAKMMPLFSAMASVFGVRPDRISAELERAGRTWAEFVEGREDVQELTTVMPTGALLELVDLLKPEDPNTLFARPKKDELVLVHDDKMLRTMIPRMDHVRYRLCRDADAEVREAVSEAVQELAASMKMRKMTELGLLQSEEPLPDLVYSSDGQDLLDACAAQGLSVRVGSMPLLVRVPDNAPPGMFPYAVGNSLYLDIDFEEAAQ